VPSVTLKTFQQEREPDERLENLQRLARDGRIPGAFKLAGRGWRVDLDEYDQVVEMAKKNQNKINDVQGRVDRLIGKSAA